MGAVVVVGTVKWLSQLLSSLSGRDGNDDNEGKDCDDDDDYDVKVRVFSQTLSQSRKGKTKQNKNNVFRLGVS